MFKALYRIIFTPYKAWHELQDNAYLQQFLLPLLVYPLLVITALSAYVPHLYGYITIEAATQDALVTFFTYGISIVSALLLLIIPIRYYITSEVGKSDIHLFVGYTYTITLLSVIVGNLLPSDFAFVQFAPIYTVWIAFQSRSFMKVPGENVFSYTVITSALILLLPFIWDKLFDIIIH